MNLFVVLTFNWIALLHQFCITNVRQAYLTKLFFELLFQSDIALGFLLFFLFFASLTRLAWLSVTCEPACHICRFVLSSLTEFSL